MSDIITILLATYNGEKYIRRQLDSLLKQTYTNWQLIIRDDCSSDNTLSVIEEYKKKYPSKIEVLDNKGKNIGSVMNFSTLLCTAANAKYIMFCDQDDEWMSHKIDITYHKMQEEEQGSGSHSPILIFTNFQYADDNLQIIKSKENFVVNRKKSLSFSHLLAQNPVYGCTVLINRAMADKVGAIPVQAENHDYWIALVASMFGNIFYLPEKTILYRQHSNNISGAFDNDSLQKRFSRIIIQKGNFKLLRKKKNMLLKLKEMYYPLMNATIKKVITDFISLYKTKSILLLFKNVQNQVVSQTISQTFLLYISLLLYKDKDSNGVNQ